VCLGPRVPSGLREKGVSQVNPACLVRLEPTDLRGCRDLRAALGIQDHAEPRERREPGDSRGTTVARVSWELRDPVGRTALRAPRVEPACPETRAPSASLARRGSWECLDCPDTLADKASRAQRGSRDHVVNVDPRAREGSEGHVDPMGKPDP
ncbi:unnamed protein product, partial [Lampetra planeri]